MGNCFGLGLRQIGGEIGRAADCSVTVLIITLVQRARFGQSGGAFRSLLRVPNRLIIEIWARGLFSVASRSNQPWDMEDRSSEAGPCRGPAGGGRSDSQTCRKGGRMMSLPFTGQSRHEACDQQQTD